MFTVDVLWQKKSINDLSVSFSLVTDFHFFIVIIQLIVIHFRGPTHIPFKRRHFSYDKVDWSKQRFQSGNWWRKLIDKISKVLFFGCWWIYLFSATVISMFCTNIKLHIFIQHVFYNRIWSQNKTLFHHWQE